MLMSANPSELQELTDVIAASVAFIEHSDENGYILVAYNKRFAQMLDITRTSNDIGVPLNTCIPRYAYPNFKQQLSQVFETGEPLEFEQPFDIASVTYWWRITVKPMIESDDVLRRLLITGIDISDRIALETNLEVSNSRFGSVINAAYDGIITMNQEQRINLFNSAAETIFGYPLDEVVGESITLLIPDRFRARHSEYVQKFSRSPIESREMKERSVIYGLRKDGTEFPAEITISKIDVDGETEFTAIIRDVSERVRLLTELERSATTDSLTGLKNRAYLNQKLEELIEVHKRYGNLFSIILIDLDHFKQINDCYGHAIGDEALRTFSREILPNFREVDLLARYGGEEFVGLLTEIGLDGAYQVAERLRSKIENRSIDPTEPGDVPFTVSIGVAEFTAEDDANSILRRADEALYRAKEAGRNRTERERQMTTQPSA